MVALTDLIQLDNVRLDAQLAQQGFGRLTVRTPGFGEDGDGVLVDDGLRFRLGGHDVLRVGRVALEDVASVGVGLVGVVARAACVLLLGVRGALQEVHMLGSSDDWDVGS